MLEDELEELFSIQNDLKAFQSVAEMTASNPAWGGDSDTVRVVACALGTVIAKLNNVTKEIRSECRGEIDVQQE